MKNILLTISILITGNLFAQNNPLPSGVYSWSKAKAVMAGKIERRQILDGPTLDLNTLEIHSSTLFPGDVNHPPQANVNGEELLIIKEGRIKGIVEDSTKTLGPGGLVLLMAGDKQSFVNTSDKPVTYYVLVYKSKDGKNIERGRAGGGSFMKDWNDYKTVKTDKGESRPIFDRPTTMFKRFDVHATTLNPGFASHAAHTHRSEEIILMKEGTAEMQIGETFYNVVPGDVILVNSNVPHAIKNKGNTPCSYFAIQWHSNAE